MPNKSKSRYWFIPPLLGLACVITAAGLVLSSDILGENTNGFATILAVVGLGLIATSPSLLGWRSGRK